MSTNYLSRRMPRAVRPVVILILLVLALFLMACGESPAEPAPAADIAGLQRILDDFNLELRRYWDAGGRAEIYIVWFPGEHPPNVVVHAAGAPAP